MTKVLYIGDPHYKHSHHDEMERLMDFIHKSAVDNQVDQIVILGDLNDTFGILRTDNQYFWEKWLTKLSFCQKLYVLVGNHDKKNQSDDSNLDNSLDIFNSLGLPNLFIIKSPVVFGPFAFVPYIHDKKRFIEESNKLAIQGAKVLICHYEFDGGTYDNGYFIKDGVKPEELNYDLVISGHIHKKSKIGKIIHPGSPRWLTSSDANQEKGLWLVEHDSETGAILKEEFLDTSKVCTPIYSCQFKEGEAEPAIPEGSKTHIELIGSSEWISKQKAKFKGRASISTKITDRQKPQNRKTGNNLAYFINNTFETSTGINKESMLRFMENLGVL
jgi:predicted phosphodiesterase